MKRYALVTAIVAVSGIGAVLPLTIAQQSQPPRPSNPQPRPVEPRSPGTQPPVPTGPSNPQPPANPNDPTNPNNPNNPTIPANPANPRNPAIKQPGTRFQRPFAFQNPADEARFNESAQRLVRLEQKLDRSQQDLTKRLGEIRQMSPDRQNAATMDLLQQMLKAQADLQQYLVTSRALWTGDIEMTGEVPADVVPQPNNPQNPVNPQPVNPPR